MAFEFIHLRVHSEFSLVDGLVKIKPLIARCTALNMPAVALTDQSNLFALIKFYKSALAGGIKPIAGADIWVKNEEDKNAPHRMTLLVQNREGYRNLTQLLSLGYQQGQYLGRSMLEPEWIKQHSQGLIALSGGREGEIGRLLITNRALTAKKCLHEWLACFDGRFYLELQRTGRAGEEEYLEQALDLAVSEGMPVVATNDVRFLGREDFEAHEARVCIHGGWILDDPKRPRPYSESQYLKSPEEMQALFSDIPEALENTVEIAKRCNLELALGKPCLPVFPVPSGRTIGEHFIAEAKAGLEQRLKEVAVAPEKRQSYYQRLQLELDVIVQMGFPGYFLIVADFIRWAKEHGIPVGPGRGSGAGSLVAYALQITDLDPLEFDLLFERFLNPERVSMPDFDVDFCMEKRDRVIDYVAEKYGRDKVAQIITFGTMAAKAVVRDVGRVLGHPYGFVDKLAKLIPFELGMTLEKALTESEDLKRAYEQDEEVQALIDLARTLEGVARNAGTHAGGVVIAPSALVDFTPLYCEEGEASVVTQFDKDDVEAAGLVKFDFLGLRTLTIIDWAVQTINSRLKEKGDAPIDINRIPRDDPETFALLKACQTTAVFQLESRGMKDLIRRLQPDCFEDIIALVALFRPGPLQSGMVDDYINVKHGRAKANYAHPSLEPILKPTNGVILYQEQVMQIARDMAGYTLGGADLLRRAMGKKKPEEMAKQRAIFVKGAVGQGVNEETASYIFDLMEKFAGYGFNKSHSAAYAWVSYQTAWLKAHYPAEFMAAVLSSDMDNTDKLVGFVEECRQLKLPLLPPDINRSSYQFMALEDGSILYGLGAIKGVGQAAIEILLAERDTNGPFRDLYDFCRRIDLRKANRRVLEALIRAGALDSFNQHRAQLMEELPLAIQTAEQHHRSVSIGQNDLFGLNSQPEGGGLSAQSPAASVQPWTTAQRLTEEKAVLGMYLSGHPLDECRQELSRFISGDIAALNKKFSAFREKDSASAVAAGLVVEVRSRQSKQGKKMVFLTLEDGRGSLEVAVFSEVWEQHADIIHKDAVLVAEGVIARDNYSNQLRLVAEKLYTVAQARERFAKGLWIVWQNAKQASRLTSQIEQLKAMIHARRGRCPVYIDYRNGKAQTRLRLGEQWQIQPDDELLQRLGSQFGMDHVFLRYE